MGQEVGGDGRRIGGTETVVLDLADEGGRRSRRRAGMEMVRSLTLDGQTVHDDLAVVLERERLALVAYEVLACRSKADTCPCE
jgi:hypothetical protein